MTALTKTPRPLENPLTPAEKVYQTPELRRYIFDFIAQKLLSSFMPICKEAFCDIARHIYAEVKYENVESLNRDIGRHAVYADGVRELSIGRWPSIHPQPEPRNSPPFTITPAGYDPADLEYLLPLLQQQFPKTVKVKFAGEYKRHGITYWTVTVPPPDSDARGGFRSHADEEGYIGLTSSIPEGFDTVTALNTFDDRSRKVALSKADVDRWGRYLRETLRDRVQSLGVGNQQITLTDLARWVDDLVSDTLKDKYDNGRTNHRVQLRTIDGTSMLPWTIAEFSSFARMSGPKLTHLEGLYLYPGNTGTGGGRGPPRSASDDERIINRPNLTVPDLQTLMKDIPAYLPSLKRLTIGIKPGSVNYEEWCSFRLPVDFPPGKLEYLSLVMPDDYTPWNLARYLAPLLTDSPQMNIKWRRGCIAGGKYASHLLRSIASAPAQRQAKLRVVDFKTLNISNICLIDKLRYDEDGNPLPFTQEEKEAHYRVYGLCDVCRDLDAPRYV